MKLFTGSSKGNERGYRLGLGDCIYRTEGVSEDILTSTLFELTGKAEKCNKLKN